METVLHGRFIASLLVGSPLFEVHRGLTGLHQIHTHPIDGFQGSCRSCSNGNDGLTISQCKQAFNRHNKGLRMHGMAFHGFATDGHEGACANMQGEAMQLGSGQIAHELFAEM